MMKSVAWFEAAASLRSLFKAAATLKILSEAAETKKKQQQS